MIEAGNLFADIPAHLPAELFTPLLTAPNVRVERIVSRGHVSPPGFWYDQDRPEWVLVLTGAAQIEFEGEPAPRAPKRGDYLHLPAPPPAAH